MSTNRHEAFHSSSHRNGSTGTAGTNGNHGSNGNNPKNSIYGLSFHAVNHDEAEAGTIDADNDEYEIELNSDLNDQLRSASDGNSSSIRDHSDNTSSAVHFGKVNSIKRYVKRCSLQRPRMFGAFLISVICVIPLLITVILLSTVLYDKTHHKKKIKTSLTTVTTEWGSFAVEYKIAAVATDDSRCSAIGKAILSLGGNAVDSAVAAALCLGVVSPGSIDTFCRLFAPHFSPFPTFSSFSSSFFLSSLPTFSFLSWPSSFSFFSY